MNTILVIEDDPPIARGIELALEAEHFRVLVAPTGEKGFALAQRENVDLITLDLMLPDRSGEDVCRDLRKKGVGTPILMLSSRKEEMDKVVGLEIGADDYMTKPFSTRELVARVRALLRRVKELPKDIAAYTIGDVRLDFRRQEAYKKKASLKLTVREFEILKYFARHEGEVVTRDMLLDEVWGYEHFPTTRTVDNYILSIRKRIEDDPAHPVHLVTVHTAGYKLVVRGAGA
ncbi:MAG TPA: response regulator transcription factor [Bacteroidota bacterium]|nr:response regulator transcription factor [Bacteroidota bacterium]